MLLAAGLDGIDKQMQPRNPPAYGVTDANVRLWALAAAALALLAALLFMEKSDFVADVLANIAKAWTTSTRNGRTATPLPAEEASAKVVMAALGAEPRR